MKAQLLLISALLSPLVFCEPATDSHNSEAGDSGRPEAGDVSDPRQQKGADKYFKSFESLEGGKSKNPSFDVGFPGEKGGEIHRCGATVIESSGDSKDSCTAMTAAHCVEPSFNKTVPVKTGYGDISAEIIPHPTYAEAHKNSTSSTSVGADGKTTTTTSEKPFDIAALKINDKKFCSKAAKVPLCDETSGGQAQKGETLYMGSSWMGKLMSGGPASGSAGSVHGDTLETVIQDTAHDVPKQDSRGREAAGINLSAGEGASGKAAITQGDSGSGLFKESKSAKNNPPLCFMGVLSTTGKRLPAGPPLPSDFSRDANYTAGKKVNQFINQFAKKGK